MGLEQQYHNGNGAAAAAAAALSVLHQIPMIPSYNTGAGAGSFGADVAAQDSLKMDGPSWDASGRLAMPDLPDKHVSRPAFRSLSLIR